MDPSIKHEGVVLYEGVTIEFMQSSMHFGDDWTDEHKRNDSEKLVDVIYVIIDLIGGLAGDLETGLEEMSNEITEGDDITSDDTTSDDTTSDDTTSEGTDNSISQMLGMLGTLGKTFDLMADTYCLQDLPKHMLEGLLKNEMLSVVMTPAMLNDYLDKIDAEDFSYESFMNELLDKVSGLLDKLNGNGGTEE